MTRASSCATSWMRALREADVRVHTTLVSARRERDAAGPWWRATLARRRGRDLRGDGQGARQCRRPVGQARARHHQRRAFERGHPPHQGQPHRRAARARGRARLHPAERGQADRLRHPLSGALHADRHHRHRGGHLRKPGDLGRRDRLSAAILPTRISRSRSRGATSYGPTAAFVRSTTTARPIRRR